MLKMEESMEKQLKEKKRELTRLKNIRHRHNEDIRNVQVSIYGRKKHVRRRNRNN
jgi:hypothetical protein